MNDVLNRLKSSFGVGAVDVSSFQVGGFKWTVRPRLSQQDIEMAVRMADSKSLSPSEMRIQLNAATLCMAVVSIDGEPTYQMFGINEEGTQPVPDTSYPPADIRHAAALKLFEFIRTELGYDLANHLFELYDSDASKRSQATLEDDVSIFECGNGHVKILTVREEHYFCPDCGLKMLSKEPAVPEEGGVLPLP